MVAKALAVAMLLTAFSGLVSFYSGEVEKSQTDLTHLLLFMILFNMEVKK